MRVNGRIMGALALAVVGAWNVGAATTPSTSISETIATSAPAPVSTVHAVTADYASPVATLKTLLTAAQQGDIATVRQSMAIAPTRSDDVNAFLDALAATARLQAAAEAKFGAVGAQRFGKPTEPELAAQLRQVEGGAISVNGNTATLTIPRDTASGQQERNVLLTKVGNEWKVNGQEYFGLTQDATEKAPERVALTRRLAVIADDMAKDIAAGKYYSSTIAFQDYWNQCMQATKTPANTTSTSAPAARPATTSGGGAGTNPR